MIRIKTVYLKKAMPLAAWYHDKMVCENGWQVRARFEPVDPVPYFGWTLASIWRRIPSDYDKLVC